MCSRRASAPAWLSAWLGSAASERILTGNMPTQLDLSAEPRDVFGKHVKRLRREGIVPANIYGHGASRAIQAPERTLERLLASGGRTGVIAINFDGRSETALLKTLQRDPRSGQILHVDFQA